MHPHKSRIAALLPGTVPRPEVVTLIMVLGLLCAANST